MYFVPMYPYPYYRMVPVYNYTGTPYYQENAPMYGYRMDQEDERQPMDQGSQGYVVNIRNKTRQNTTFRTAIWTGNYLQVTVMSIPVGEDIGLEVHTGGDQFLRIEEGEGIVRMGDSQNTFDMEKSVYGGYAIMIPAGKWHNVINTGNRPLKLYTIYAPPEHPYGTVHETKGAAMSAENHH